ncbi:MAG TPA: folylpolyglutamate synthase/dihydrofolate synthase family protein [Gemmatimonadaceae bacterium]
MDSGLTDYKAAVDALFARTGSTAKFGLERTSRFLEQLGNPHQRFDSFHVAGTNGKGSTVATLYELLRSKGLSVGRYMSPHLIDFRERIVVDECAISEQSVIDFLDRCAPDAERFGATFFEITTALAFHHFAESLVDVAVIETGLGGRLDSTNLITPVAAGITSIGLDHREFLGDTEESIAREKAGIFKNGRPGIIGPVSRAARQEIVAVGNAAGASLIDAQSRYETRDTHLSMDGTTFTVAHDGETRALTAGLVGRAQAANASVALAMLESAPPRYRITLDEAAKILPQVSLPGRFQRVGNMIFDVAHNPDGIRSLISTLREVIPEALPVLVLGVLADKDWREMIRELKDVATRMILVRPPSAPPSRAWDLVEAERFAHSLGINAAVEREFEKVVESVARSNEVALVTGSFHTVGDALAQIGKKAF